MHVHTTRPIRLRDRSHSIIGQLTLPAYNDSAIGKLTKPYSVYHFNVLRQQSCDLYEMDILGIKSICTFFCGFDNLYDNNNHGNEIEDANRHAGDSRLNYSPLRTCSIHNFRAASLMVTSIFIICRKDSIGGFIEKDNHVIMNSVEPTSVATFNDAAYGMFVYSSSRASSVSTYSVFDIINL